MRILVTFAVEAEFAPWRKLRHFEKKTAAGMDYFSSQVAHTSVDVVLTGVATKRNWCQITHALYNSEVDVCISGGLAGALRPGHTVGQVLVAEKILAAHCDLVAESESSLIDAAVALDAKRIPYFYTADHVVLNSDEKRELGKIADAVEMESFAILREACLFAARAVAIRAISDSVDESLPIDFNGVMTETGEVSLKRVLGKVATSPSSLPSLIRFGQQSRAAAELLAQFLEKYVQKLVQEQPLDASVGALSR
jgi:nucleoside phosphorylase